MDLLILVEMKKRSSIIITSEFIEVPKLLALVSRPAGHECQVKYHCNNKFNGHQTSFFLLSSNKPIAWLLKQLEESAAAKPIWHFSQGSNERAILVEMK